MASPTSTLSVRTVSAKDDLAQLATDINSAYWTEENEMEGDEFSANSLKRYLDDASNLFLVAYYEQTFAGMASATIRERAYEDSRWLYVDELDVTSTHRRLGVGTMLMRALLEIASQRKCVELWLGTESDNTAAQALYNSLGPSETEAFLGSTYK